MDGKSRERQYFVIWISLKNMSPLKDLLTSMTKPKDRLEASPSWRFCTKSPKPAFFPCIQPSEYKLHFQDPSKLVILYMVKGQWPFTLTKGKGVMFTSTFSIIRTIGEKNNNKRISISRSTLHPPQKRKTANLYDWVTE